MKKIYEPKTEQQKLGYLVEECGETLAAVGKSQRWGLESFNPELDNPSAEENHEWVLREIKDLKRAIRIVEKHLKSEY